MKIFSYILFILGLLPVFSCAKTDSGPSPVFLKVKAVSVDNKPLANVEINAKHSLNSSDMTKVITDAKGEATINMNVFLGSSAGDFIKVEGTPKNNYIPIQKGEFLFNSKNEIAEFTMLFDTIKLQKVRFVSHSKLIDNFYMGASSSGQLFSSLFKSFNDYPLDPYSSSHRISTNFRAIDTTVVIKMGSVAALYFSASYTTPQSVYKPIYDLTYKFNEGRRDSVIFVEAF